LKIHHFLLFILSLLSSCKGISKSKILENDKKGLVCAEDTDGDGIIDVLDLDNFTSFGVKVDTNGVAIDSISKKHQKKTWLKRTLKNTSTPSVFLSFLD
jgi:hypothetical protein